MSVTLAPVLMVCVKMEQISTCVSVILDGLETTATIVRNKTINVSDFVHGK